MAAFKLSSWGEYVMVRARAWVPPDFAPRRWWRLQRQWRHLRRLAGQQLLRAFAEAYPRARFIQIGANDGCQQDPLSFVRQRYGWGGVMVEPVPYVFARLRERWGATPNLRLENAAIAESDGPRPFYHLAHAADPAGLPSWYDGLGSFSRETLLKHAQAIPDIERRLVCTQVPCLSFESLCRKHGLADAEVVHIDAEGYDDRIVQQIDFVRQRPRLLVYEHFHLDAVTRAALQRRLEQHGYAWMEEYLDTWCLDMSERTDPRVRALWRRLRPQGTA